METEFKRSVKGAEVYSESTAEYVLPDYNNDVRKILYSEARVRPAGKFVGNDEAELNGVIVYNVIYSDAEGKMGGTVFTSDYEFTSKLPSEGIENVFADTRASNFALRLVNPRKLSAKCSLTSSLIYTEKKKYSPTGSAFESDEGPESDKMTLSVRTTLSSESLEREYAEEICRLDGAIEDEVKVVYCKAEIIPESLCAQGNSVRIQGELLMSALIENGESPAYVSEKRIKLDENVGFESISEKMCLTPVFTVTSEKTTVRADEDGCDIVMDVVVELSVIGDENRELAVISDAFSTVCPVENSYTQISYCELYDSVNLSEKHEAKLSREDASEGAVREVLFVSAEAKTESLEVTPNKLTIKGEVKYSGIVSEVNDDGTISYSAVKSSSPFEQNVKIDCQNPENIRVEAKCKAINAESTIDANTIYFSSSLQTSVMINEEKKEKILLDCTLCEGEPFDKDEAVIRVYCPEEGETLFSVAKKFHMTLSRLCENNSLAEQTSLNKENTAPVLKKLMIY